MVKQLRLNCLCMVLASTGIAGCATVKYRVVTSETDKSDLGIRYYETSPYLLAYSDGKGGVVTSIQYLPDPTRKMSAEPSATLADVQSTLEFDRGVLTSSSNSGDATAVAKAVTTAVETIGGALIAGAANEPGKAARANYADVPAPYIFKIVIDKDSVKLIGARAGVPSFRVSLLPQTDKPKEGPAEEDKSPKPKDPQPAKPAGQEDHN